MLIDCRECCDSATAQRGFSLLELVIVLMIIAALSAIVVPRYSGALARYRAESAARRIAADLEYARAQADSQSASQQIIFDVAANSYQLTGLSGLDHPSLPYFVDLSDDLAGATLVAVDFGGDSTVVFNGYGVPDSGGTIAIKVGSVQETIALDPYTGKVSLQ